MHSPTTPSGSTPAAEESLRVAVIGSGPHALSLLCRVVDDDADLLDEAERTRVAAKAGSRARSHAEVRKALQRRFVDAAAHLAGVAVFDSGGEWMGQWRRDFSALEIEHCRSHSDLHPCPHDFQSLRVWAEKHKRELEMWHMAYLDRGAARAAGFSGPYALPGTRLFLDFCASLVARYKLAPLVRKATIAAVEVVPPPPDACAGAACSFRLRLADGTSVRAARVVCAMGPGPMFAGMRANLPWWCEAAAGSLAAAGGCGGLPRLCHSSQLVRELLDAEGKAALRGSRVLVVGGGQPRQTAGHLCLVAVKNGATAVTLAARRPIVRKPFDVDLQVVGDRRGEALSSFWAAPPCDRPRLIGRLRGGGSMAGEVYASLLRHAAARGDGELGGWEGGGGEGGGGEGGGVVSLLEEVEVESAAWRPAGGEGGGSFDVSFDDGSSERFDYVWLATGGEMDLSLVPLFAQLLAQVPIQTHGGLPALQQDLSWAAHCPLHVMGPEPAERGADAAARARLSVSRGPTVGAFAQLELGADALNLAGCRAGSVRIARSLRPFLRTPHLSKAGRTASATATPDAPSR